MTSKKCGLLLQILLKMVCTSMSDGLHSSFSRQHWRTDGMTARVCVQYTADFSRRRFLPERPPVDDTAPAPCHCWTADQDAETINKKPDCLVPAEFGAEPAFLWHQIAAAGCHADEQTRQRTCRCPQQPSLLSCQLVRLGFLQSPRWNWPA